MLHLQQTMKVIVNHEGTSAFWLKEIMALPCITKNTLVVTSSSSCASALDYWNDRMLPWKTEMARETPLVALTDF